MFTAIHDNCVVFCCDVWCDLFKWLKIINIFLKVTGGSQVRVVDTMLWSLFPVLAVADNLN